MDKERQKQAIDRVLRDMAGAMVAGLALVGTRTGLFRSMAGKGPMTLDDVVSASALQRRYVEEWLKGMTSAGYLDFQDGKYTLSDEMAYFVASEGTDHFVGGMWEMVPPLIRVAPRVAEAFAKGLVNRVLPDADVEKEAYATAARIAAAAPLVNRWHKKFVKRLLDPRPLTAAELEDNYACFGTEDFQIGYRAFLAKAKPQFKGR